MQEGFKPSGISTALGTSICLFVRCLNKLNLLKNEVYEVGYLPNQTNLFNAICTSSTTGLEAVSYSANGITTVHTLYEYSTMPLLS